MYYYKVFGLIASSQVPFIWPVEEVVDSTDISCEIVQSSHPIVMGKMDLIYTSHIIHSKTSQPNIQIFSSTHRIFLSYTGIVDFDIQHKRITYYLSDFLDRKILETLLFRVVFVLWLELNRMQVLHASGVVVEGAAIGFLANSTTGKSTLAAGFLRSGAKFLTDDIFTVEPHAQGYQARPSYSWLRLLPEAARALDYQAGQHDTTNPEKFIIRLDASYGRFYADPAPLIALYLPVRRDDIDDISINVLSPTQAYLGLLQHAFVGKWLVRSSLTVQRMEFFAKLVKEVPIKRLIYPSGYEHLSTVVGAVNRDLGF